MYVGRDFSFEMRWDGEVIHWRDIYKDGDLEENLDSIYLCEFGGIGGICLGAVHKMYVILPRYGGSLNVVFYRDVVFPDKLQDCFRQWVGKERMEFDIVEEIERFFGAQL